MPQQNNQYQQRPNRLHDHVHRIQYRSLVSCVENISLKVLILMLDRIRADGRMPLRLPYLVHVTVERSYLKMELLRRHSHQYKTPKLGMLDSLWHNVGRLWMLWETLGTSKLRDMNNNVMS